MAESRKTPPAPKLSSSSSLAPKLPNTSKTDPVRVVVTEPVDASVANDVHETFKKSFGTPPRNKGKGHEDIIRRLQDESGVELQRVVPNDVEQGQVASQGLIVDVPQKTGTHSSASWVGRPMEVPQRTIPNPGTNFEKINPDYTAFLKLILDTLATNQDNWKFWDTTGFVAGLFTLVLGLLASIRLIYNKASGSTTDANSPFNTTMDAVVLGVGFAAAVVALWSRHSRNNNAEMVQIGSDSLVKMEEEVPYRKLMR